MLQKDIECLNKTKAHIMEALAEIAEGKTSAYRFDTSTDSWDSEDICMISKVDFAPGTKLHLTPDVTTQYELSGDSVDDPRTQVFNIEAGPNNIWITPDGYPEWQQPLAIDFWDSGTNILVWNEYGSDPVKIPFPDAEKDEPLLPTWSEEENTEETNQARKP